MSTPDAVVARVRRFSAPGRAVVPWSPRRWSTDATGQRDTATGRDFTQWAIRAAPWVVLVLAKLWLVDGQRLTAYGSLTIDDQWFVERASWISAGEWFGPFDAYTLIKQPGYPLFVAAVHAVRVPLLLAHQLVYVFAVAIMMVALRTLDPLAVAAAGRVRLAVVQPDDDEHADLGARGPLGDLSRPDGAAARLSRRTGVVV